MSNFDINEKKLNKTIRKLVDKKILLVRTCLNLEYLLDLKIVYFFNNKFNKKINIQFEEFWSIFDRRVNLEEVFNENFREKIIKNKEFIIVEELTNLSFYEKILIVKNIYTSDLDELFSEFTNKNVNTYLLIDFFDKMRKVRNKACHTSSISKENFDSYFLPINNNIKIKYKYSENSKLNTCIYLLYTIDSKFSINFKLEDFKKIF